MPEIGLRGNLLPVSESDFADNYDAMRFKRCMRCDSGFTKENTTTRLGWRETQLSGFCEKCFDEVTGETLDINA